MDTLRCTCLSGLCASQHWLALEIDLTMDVENDEMETMAALMNVTDLLMVVLVAEIMAVRRDKGLREQPDQTRGPHSPLLW